MKTLAIFTIFVLISGVAFTSSANNAYAQNDPSILLRIATQADKQILNQLDRSYGAVSYTHLTLPTKRIV